MAKDYAAISKKIVENIGGVENIASVTHCTTQPSRRPTASWAS